MTEQAKFLHIQLVNGLKKDLSIPAEHAICACLLLIAQNGLGIEDAREMLDYLRMEWGMERERWNKMVKEQLKDRPNTPEFTRRELIIP